MNDFVENIEQPIGTDRTLYEMPVAPAPGYDYTNLLTASVSKAEFGAPTLEQLGSLLCEHSKEITSLRNKSNLGYYANSDNTGAYYASIDMEDVQYIKTMINTMSIAYGDRIDFLLSSPGGYIQPTKKLIELVNQSYTCSYLIYDSAYSSATIMALGGSEIVLQQFGHLAPVNPRINGFDTYIAKKVYKTHMWHKILCPWAANSLPEAKVAENNVTMKVLLDLEKLTYRQVNKGLCNLLGIKKWSFNLRARIKVNQLTNFFTDYSKHNSHMTPFYAKALMRIGLPFTIANEELDKQMFILSNICSELTTTKWNDDISDFYVRKIYYSSTCWWILKHRVTN